MIITCPYCHNEQAVFYDGVVRCSSCRERFVVRRIGNKTTVLGLYDQSQPRYVSFEMVDVRADVPVRATQQSTGCDLSVIEGGLVWPGFARVFDTGIRLHMASDQHVDLRPRAGWFRKGLIVNSGLIDPDFTDSVKILCRNVRPWPIRVRVGDRLAQLVLLPDTLLVFHETPYPVEAPIEGRERIGGLGSTGR